VAIAANRSSLVHHKHNIGSCKKKTKDYTKIMNCCCLYLNKHSMAHASMEWMMKTIVMIVNAFFAFGDEELQLWSPNQLLCFCNSSVKLDFFFISLLFGITCAAPPEFLARLVRPVGTPVRLIHFEPATSRPPCPRPKKLMLSYIIWDMFIIGDNSVSRTSWWFFNMWFSMSSVKSEFLFNLPSFLTR
jgi:hypothetical protein